MQSTFEDLKKLLIEKGKQIDYSDPINFEEDYAEFNKDYVVYKLIIENDDPNPILYFGYFDIYNTDNDEVITFCNSGDLAIRYNETLNTIEMKTDEMSKDSIGFRRIWKTLEFDENSNYIDDGYTDKYPFFVNMFFNHRSDIDDFISEIKENYKDVYFMFLDEKIGMLNEITNEYNQEIKRLQDSINKNAAYRLKLKYAKSPILDFLKTIKEGDKCFLANGKEATLWFINDDTLFWKIPTDKTCFNTYLNGEPVIGSFFIENEEIAKDYKIIKKA